MFKKAQHIDSAFRQIRAFCSLFLLGSLVLSGFVVYKSLRLVSESQAKVYILANGKALEAYGSDRKDNIPVEARDHIKTFHHNFFTLDPDEKVITANITRALYLADGSAKKEYDNLKESGYYSNLISANISQQIDIDSIKEEKLIRATSIVTRDLVTEGYLRNVSRSDNNPHGFLIERWLILENKDLKIENR
jgi:conjugative transposon TraK protein